MVVFHQELDGIATSPTTEAFVDILGGRNSERRCFFVMKWAQSYQVNASALQLYIILHHVLYLNFAKNFIDGGRRYHNYENVLINY